MSDFLQWWKQSEGEALTAESLRKDPYALNKKIIQDYVNHLERSVAIATLLRKVSSLRAFVTFLQVSKAIEHEPMNGLRLPRKAEPEPRGLNDNQRARFEAGFQNPWIDKTTKRKRSKVIEENVVREATNQVIRDKAIAWIFAFKHPERLHKLGILNVPHPLVMRRFLQRDFEQIRRSWYTYFFQLPWLPELGMRAGNWRGAVRALSGSGKIHTFSNDDIEKYKEAWSQPGAITSMINWYRSAARYFFQLPKEMRIHVPTLLMWGMKDVALTHRMARPSMDHCDEGNLILFPESTHWVQHDAAEEVNHYLIDFLLDKMSKRMVK